jgi:ABC-type antimicrobial peptide transport system permease subunit
MQLVASDLWLPASMYADLASSSGSGGSGSAGTGSGGSGSGTGSGSDGKAGTQPDVEMTPMFGVMGRLSPEMTAIDAEARLTPIAAELARARGVSAPPAVVVRPATGFGVPPALEGTVMTLSGIVYAMMALLMAIACANVAALVLARGVGRTREIAVRLSLGASKLHIARQLLIESSMLAVAGCIAGSLVAFWLTQALVARLSTPFEYVSYAIDVRPDARVFAYAALITAFAAILCGIAPIRYAVRVDVLDVLKQSAARGRSRQSRRTLNAMVALQFAVSTALLAGAGMLLRAYVTSSAAQPGFDTRGLIVASLDVDQLGIDPARHAALYDTVLERLSSLPGVTSASLTRDLPRASSSGSGSGSGSGAGRNATVFADAASVPDASSSSTPGSSSNVGGGRGETGERVPAASNVVSSRYFQTLGLTLRQGRTFDDNEPARPLTAVIDETMARRLWPNASPLGRTFRLDRADSEPIHVIGVVSSTHDTTSSEPPTPVFYQPFPHQHAANMNVLLRTRAEPGAMFVDIRRAVQSINRDLAIVDLRTLDQMNAQNARQRRMPAVLLAAISLLGLLLSAVGLYGVIAYVVRERARELGIRLALGARPADVRALVLRQGFLIVFVGLAIGMAATLTLSRIMRSLMSGIGVIDPLTAGVVCAVLLTAGFAALYLPARWASTLDPAHTLRSE